jgi:hypothetical protein
MINNSENQNTTLINNIEAENNKNDKTFNKLREIQSLIKKESALRELCKKIIFLYNDFLLLLSILKIK